MDLDDAEDQLGRDYSDLKDEKVNAVLRPALTKLINHDGGDGTYIANVPEDYSKIINGTGGYKSLRKTEYCYILSTGDFTAPDRFPIEDGGDDQQEADDQTPDKEDDGVDVDASEVQVEIDDSEMTGMEKEMARTFNSAISIKSGDIQDAFDKALNSTKKEIRERLEELKNLEASRVEIQLPDGEIQEADNQHKKFGKVAKLAGLRHNVLLVGPAGTGKTRMAEEVAEQFDLPFYSKSIGPRSSEYEFFGSMNAEGDFVPTEFYEAYTEGGVYLLDEMDCANPSTLKAINSAVANGHATFKVLGKKERHEDFIFFGAANTYGRGADMQYVGANQLDAASLDRFTVATIDYDEALEKQISPNTDWTKIVQRVRETVRELDIRHVVSMRASIKGGELLEAGFDAPEVAEMVLWKGLEEDQKEKVIDNLDDEYVDVDFSV